MKRWKTALSACLLCGLMVALIVFSDTAKEGAREGMGLCENLLIPSLLPMMILSSTLVTSDANRLLSRLLGGFTEKALHLPRQAAGAVILGLTCGYPTGAMLTASLLRSGQLSRKEARRMLRFNCCGGIAFTVTAVGSLTLRSVHTGVVLLCINITAALCYAMIEGALHRRERLTGAAMEGSHPSVADALPAAVTASLKGLAVMCGFIIFFAALAAMIPLPSPLLPLLEITKGICQNETPIPLPYTAFFLSFGGLCLHLQLIGYLKQIGMPYYDFISGRLACAVMSFAIGKLYMLLFPASSAVFCNLSSQQSRFSEGGAALGIVMIAGCAVFVMDLKNRKLQLA